MASKMTCKNSPKTFYTGKEMSPLGVGFCADAEKVGVKMTGKDGKEWVVGLKKGNKLWNRTKDEPKTPEPEPQSEVEDKDDETDKEKSDSESESESESEEEKPAPKPKPKEKAAPKEKAKPKAKAKKEDTETDESEEEKPKPKAKKETKSALDKVLDTHNIHGKAAEDIKALFAKKAKKAKDDEEKPKRAPSTYNKFVSVKLTELRKEQPNLPAKEYMQLAGAQWKMLSDIEKAAFA